MDIDERKQETQIVKVVKGGFRFYFFIYNIDFAPVILKNVYNKEKDLKVILSNWFKCRGIPLWRDDLALLLAN